MLKCYCMTNDINLHEGHRERISQKLTHYPDSLTETELLEVLLFQCNKRKDTSPIAKTLINTFGSLGKVLDAEPDALLKIKGVGKQTVAFLKLQCVLIKRIANDKKRAKQRFVLKEFKEKLIKDFDGFTKEFFNLYLLDKNSYLIGTLSYESHLFDEVKIDTQSVAKSIAITAPAMVVMAHNHFSGDVTPSRTDDVTTVKLRDLLALHGVKLVDHIIVYKDQTYSYFYTNRVLPDKTTL